MSQDPKISQEDVDRFFSGITVEPVDLKLSEVLPAARPVKETALDLLRLWQEKLTKGGLTEWALQMLCYAENIHSRLVTLDDRLFVAVNLIRYVMANLPPDWLLWNEDKIRESERLRQEWRSQVGGCL
jgi:hypothetical protein